MKPADRPIRAVAILAGAAMTFAVTQTLVVPALPKIQQEFDVSPTATAWLITGFLLTASISIPLMGRLGDMYGKTKLLLLCFAVFSLGNLISTFGALEESFPALVGGRAITGIGAGLIPLSLGIVRDILPAHRVTLGVGLVASTQGIGSGLGLVASGIIVDHASVAFIFAGSLPIATAVAIATWRWVPESTARTGARLDWPGAVLLSLTLLALLLSVSRGNAWGWTSVGVLGLLALAGVAGAAWAWWEKRADDPMVDLKMMRERTVWTTNLVTIAAGFGMFASFMLVPQFVQVPAASGYGFGASGTAAGLFMLPHSALMLVAGTLSGLLGTRYGSKIPLALGSLVAAISYFSLAFVNDHGFQIYLGTALMGFGVGLTLASVASLTVQAVARQQTGVAMGMNAIMRLMGGAVGAQVAAAIITAKPGANGLPTQAGFTAAFAVSSAAALLTLVLVAAVPGRPDSIVEHGPIADAAAGI